MTKILGSITSFEGGIADSTKEGQKNSFAFGRAIDFRTDAKKITLLPKAVKESGSSIDALPKWAERIGTDTYIYDALGNLYKRTSAVVYSKEHTAPISHGNGLLYFGEDNYLYYTQDKTFGRFGPVGHTTENWYDDFLGSEGGVPTNTHSAVLELDSSQYFSRADTASLSITGDISLEAYVKPESLPATSGEMCFMSKWNESGATRSYWFGIRAIANYFGDGSDGALTISSDTTEAPIDSACTGTVDTYALTATNTSFAAGQKILIHQTQGTGAGLYQLTTIAAYTAGTITTSDPLNRTYTTGAQVRVMKQYTNVTIDVGKTYTVKAWNGTVGGILAFFANGTVTVNGTVSAAGGKGQLISSGASPGGGATGGGFRGGNALCQSSNGATSYSGEGTIGASVAQTTANGNGGGGAYGRYANDVGAGGGGHATSGTDGLEVPGDGDNATPGTGGGTGGSADLTTLIFGGGGGGGLLQDSSPSSYYASGGGSGGGILCIFGTTITMGAAGIITANGGDADQTGTSYADGGAGAGGSILLKCQTGTFGTTQITATGGAAVQGINLAGGPGGNGRIHVDYYTSYTGTTSPTIDATIDNTLGASDGHELRFGVSSDGTATEFYSTEITSDIAVDVWKRWAVTWDASASEAKFYKNGILLTTKTGALTAIHNNASEFFVGANKNAAGNAENFLDGKADDFRVWNDVRTATELVRYNDSTLVGNEPGLVAWYKFDNDAADSQTDGLNDLTGSGAPTYDATDPAFSGLTSRTDLDQSLDTSGNTYSLTTAINEGATHRQSFVPAKDPQESIQVLVAAKGTGNWTLTVHDALNRTIASKTIASAEIVNGDTEFIFSSVWRPIIGATYHFHLTSTVADGTVTTTDAGDLETADFHTYYQFLVEDTDFHPIAPMLNFFCIGNERYLATYDGATYTPHRLTLPSGYKIRCFGSWREYIAIGTWRGSSITAYDTGRIFFWDGYSDTYNFYIDVPEGGINALFGTKGLLYVWAGYSGDILLYAGGDSAQKIKRFPKVENNEYLEIYPGAVDMWRAMIHMGVAGNSDSNNLEKGVYSYGSLNRNYRESLGYDFPLSTDTRTGDSVKIGMIKSLGQTMLVGWQSGISHGIDKLDVTANPYASGTYEYLITDFGTIGKEKYPLILKATFEELESGESIVIKHKPNRATNWNEITEDTASATEVRQSIHKQIKELQIAVDLKTTTTTSPTLTGISIETEKGDNERLA